MPSRTRAAAILLAVSCAACVAVVADGRGSPREDQPAIAFSRSLGAPGADYLSAIWLVRRDGTALTQLTQPPDGANDQSPRWSPDRRHIAFVRSVNVGSDFRDDPIFRDDVMVMRADGGGLRRLRTGSWNPEWSPDGKRIAFGDRHAGRAEVWVIGADGKNARRLALGANPSWSPNGRQIAFERNEQVFVMDSDGRRQRRLVPALAREHYFPAWSPDGRRIALVVCFCRTGFVALWVYVVDRDGTNLRRIANEGSASSIPEWSPDGSDLLIQRGLGTGSTIVVPASGSAGRRIAGDTDHSEWSPDGRSIAVSRYLGRLAVIPSGGGERRTLATDVTSSFDW